MVFADSIVNPTDDNATATLYALLKGLNAKVTRATVRDELSMHPDFPSLLSLSDLLTSWNVDNTALQLNTVEQLRELPIPFIAHLNKHKGWYVLVTELSGNRIAYTDSETGRRTETVDEFKKNWSGVVLLAEADEQSGEVDYAQNHPKEIRENLRVPFLLAGSLLVAFIVLLTVGKDLIASDWLLLLTKSTGLLLSGLVVAKQLGRHNALTDRLCQLNSKINCDSVLNSLGAKLWGWLSWADIGLIYFAGGLLTVLVTGTVPTVRLLLYWLALLTLPYTVYCVYYQARVVQQWCTLCLAVQAVLLAEGVLAATQPTTFPNFWQPYTVLLTAFLLPILAWVLVKPLLTNATKSQQERDELLRLKRNPVLFQALLMQQPQMPSVPDDLHPIVLGNPNAEHTMTLVTNPFCEHCAKAHEETEKLLNYSLDIRVQIVLTTDGPDGRSTRVAMHIMALARYGLAQKALADWYRQSARDYEQWMRQYPVYEQLLDQQLISQSNQQWCTAATITTTPTIYVDGYRILEHYTAADMLRMIQHTKPAPAYSLL